jgi:hypothetical protein
MKRRILMARAVIGALALYLSFEVGAVEAWAAEARAACPSVSDPSISVQVIDPGPSVVSTQSLDEINVMAGSHGLMRNGFRVLGMTEVKIDSAVNMRFKGQSVGNTVCVSVSRVEVHFGLKKHVVHVPREYPRGSCKYNVVMRHEMAHVDVNRRTVRKYADALRVEMLSALRRSGARAAPSMELGQRAQTAVIKQVIDGIKTRFNAELRKLHAVIDEPNGKYAAAGRCRGW